jgi:hypothetical protein
VTTARSLLLLLLPPPPPQRRCCRAVAAVFASLLFENPQNPLCCLTRYAAALITTPQRTQTETKTGGQNTHTLSLSLKNLETHQTYLENIHKQNNLASGHCVDTRPSFDDLVLLSGPEEPIGAMEVDVIGWRAAVCLLDGSLIR